MPVMDAKPLFVQNSNALPWSRPRAAPRNNAAKIGRGPAPSARDRARITCRIAADLFLDVHLQAKTRLETNHCTQCKNSKTEKTFPAKAKCSLKAPMIWF
jgi:hypothetical protein